MTPPSTASRSTTARERMLSGLPVVERVVEADGVRTSVLEAGTGPPLVLLHGGIECGGVMWTPVLARLAERYRVVVPDVPGLGVTAPLDRVSAASFTGWLRGVLTHTGARRSTVVAHSLTGGLAVRAAARDDDLAARLVVYAAPAVGPYRMPVRLRYVAARFAARPTVPNAERRIRFALLDRDATRRRDPGWYDAFSAYITARAAVPSVARTMRQLLGAGTRRVLDTDLARVAVPVSVLWGRHDRMVPLALGATAAAYHGWPLAVVGRAAHAPHIEQPDAFVEALSTLLDPAQPASTVPASGGPIGR